MSAIKDWGLQIFHQLEDAFMRYGNIAQAEQEVVAQLWATGNYEDHQWLASHVNAVRRHPTLWGGTDNHWRFRKPETRPGRGSRRNPRERKED